LKLGKDDKAMKAPIDLSQLRSAEEKAGDDPEVTESLHEMLARAERYIKSFKWCPAIAERYVAISNGDVIALFLFKFERPINDNDWWLWVIEGDLPSAYFVVDEARDRVTALHVYCELMEDWATAVETGSPLDDVFPVDVPATKKNAEQLRLRIRFIREHIAPAL
jgi:hypothetical protein